MTNVNPLHEQWMKEDRAKAFQRTGHPTPILPDTDFEARLGERINAGNTREVFKDRLESKRVIKRALGARVAGNWMEHMIWTAARDTRWAPVIAECFAISESGLFLSMERLEVPLPSEQYRNIPMLPLWLNDLKSKNFGVAAGNRIKVCDYAMVNISFDLDEALPHKPGFALDAR
jgi:hypothetical protein